MKGVHDRNPAFLFQQTTALKHFLLSMMVLPVCVGLYYLFNVFFFQVEAPHGLIQMRLTYFLGSLGASPCAASVIHSAIVAFVWYCTLEV